MNRSNLIKSVALLAVVTTGCQQSSGPVVEAPAGQWLSLFNGKDLSGWTPKISRHPLGENYGNTYRVENGVLSVAYDQYQDFGSQFGSLFYSQKFSNYWLRIEYRFVGEPAKGAPVWAYKDSGIQFHSPALETMTVDQEFPISVEFNLIGGQKWWRRRQTGNVCLPGTKADMNGKPIPGCSSTSTITIRGDEWVTALLHVEGDKRATHYINGVLVASYENMRLDPEHADAKKLLASGVAPALSEGYISVQSNSHPIQFRKIEILPIEVKHEASTP
jgi:hypothetical protein